MASRRLLALALGLMTALPALPVGAAPQPAPDPPERDPFPVPAEVVPAGRRDTSPPLRELARIAEPIAGTPRPPLTRPGGRPRAPSEADGALSPAAAAAGISPEPAVSFQGIENVDNQTEVGRLVLPPDPNGDIGPNHYFQITNLVFEIFNRDGTSAFGPEPNNALWAGFGGPCQNTNDGDPIVLYDHLADRWMASQFASPNFPQGPHFQCIAVSATRNPTGGYHRYQFKWHNQWLHDYPKLGVWPDGYYMSANQFAVNRPGTPFVGAGVAAFQRARMLRGRPAAMVKFDLSGRHRLFGLLPADLDGPAPQGRPPAPFLQVDDDAFFGVPRDRLKLLEFDVHWRRPARSSFDLIGHVRVADFDASMCNFSSDRDCIPQPFATQGLDAIADRAMYRLQYRNMGTHQAMVVNHTVDVDPASNAYRAGVRWYELRNEGQRWKRHQQGTFAGDDPGTDDKHRWMGSVALDGNGNMAVGYSVSNDTDTFPSIWYTGRLVSDDRGDLGAEMKMRDGIGSQESTTNRWGDYTMMAVDPSGCEFWYTNEWYPTVSPRNWSTEIGHFGMPAAGDSAPPGSVVMTQPGAAFQHDDDFRVTWNADDCQSGVAGHDVRVRQAHFFDRRFGPREPWKPDTQATSDGFNGRDGNTYCFLTRAEDNDGNRSLWSPRECTAVPVNDRAMRTRGNWNRRRGGGFFQRTYTMTRQQGARLIRHGVDARALALVATKCRQCGVVDVFLDGNRLRRVDLQRSGGKRNVIIPVMRSRRVRSGTVAIEVVSRREKIKIEGLGVSLA